MKEQQQMHAQGRHITISQFSPEIELWKTTLGLMSPHFEMKLFGLQPNPVVQSPTPSAVFKKFDLLDIPY